MTKIVVDMPAGTEDYVTDIELFVIRMLKKLALNMHKGGWRGADVDNLMDLLQDEVDELTHAIHDDEGPEAIRDEAADVANFAMMVSSVVRRENG